MAQSGGILANKLRNLTHRESSDYGVDYTLLSELENTAIELLNIAGHNRENIFVGLEFEAPVNVNREFGINFLSFTAVAAKDVASPAYVAIRAELADRDRIDPNDIDDAIAQRLLAYDATSRAEYTVLLTNRYIAILGDEYPPYGYNLLQIDSSDADEIIGYLDPPEHYPEGIGAKFPAGYHPHQTKLTRWLFTDSEIIPEYQSEIKTEHFELDIDRYSELIYEAYSVEDERQKGDALEDVAEYLFDGLAFVDIRDRNLSTRSDEIDLVLEYRGSEEYNLFDEYSRYSLVECKNTKKPVSSEQISHFEKILSRTDSKLGILISWNGISGEESGKYAQRYVDLMTPPGPNIIVLDSNDLYQILDGRSLYDILDEKLYSLRFDLV